MALNCRFLWSCGITGDFFSRVAIMKEGVGGPIFLLKKDSVCSSWDDETMGFHELT